MTDKQIQAVKFLKKNPYKLGHAVGFKDLTALNNEWIVKMITAQTDCTLQAHRGSYKCFAPDTMVMMSDYSSKPIKDIKVGEFVMGWDGTPREVKDIHCGNSPMYRVTLNKNGEYYECNHNHILTLRQRPIKNNKFHCVDQYRYEKDRNIINIPIEDFLKSPANRTTHGNGKGDAFFKHFKVGIDTMPDKDVKIPPYVLGLWLGDGDKSKVGITCDDKDIEHIKEFEQWAMSFDGVKKHTYKNTMSNATTYVYNGGGIIRIFKEYDLYKNKHIPDDYMYNSREKRLELLAGLIDSDGHYGTCHFTFVNKNEKLAKQVEWLARSLGFNAKATEHDTFCTYKGEKKCSKFWQVYINGDIDQIPTRIPRKKATPKTQTGHLSFSQTIEPIGNGDFVGIVIDGDGMFLLDNFLVVHNTTCVSIALALIMLLLPKKTILFMRKTDTDIKEVIAQVKKMLQSDYFRQFTMILWGVDISFTSANQTELTTNLAVSVKGTPQLTGLGIGGSLTGKHYDIIFTDDIVNLSDRISRAERDRTKLIYQELQNIKNRGGRIFNTGTPWHKEDCFSIMPEAEKYDCYSTGLIAPDTLQEIQSKMLPSLFAANYKLIHIASEDVIFTNPNINADPALAEQGDCHIDAAYAGEDFTAFTIMRKTDGKFYVFGKCWRKHIDDCLAEILALKQQFNAGVIYTENNADKGYLAKDLRQRGERVISYHEDMNKFVKITSYLKAEWQNVYFVAGTDEAYISQICDYNENAEHDDCPDSLSSLIRKKWYHKDSNTKHNNIFSQYGGRL